MSLQFTVKEIIHTTFDDNVFFVSIFFPLSARENIKLLQRASFGFTAGARRLPLNSPKIVNKTLRLPFQRNDQV